MRSTASNGIPLLVIPAGTPNHFARDLGVEDLEHSLAALREGQTVEVDAGLVNDVVFMNTFSIGAYLELVQGREQHEAQIGEWPATLLGTARVLRHGSTMKVRIVDGDRPLARLRLMIALATGTLANCPVYHCRSVSPVALEFADGEPMGYSIDGEGRRSLSGRTAPGPA
jgi:undecaprenyl-diphosphatase